MSECSHTGTCELFPMISVNSALRVWRTFYCESKWHECARYKLSLAGKSVPPNLLPNGKSLDLAIGVPSSAPKSAPAPTPTSAVSAGKASAAEDIGVIDLDAPVAPAPPLPAVVPATSLGNTMSYYLRIQITAAAGVMTEIIRSLGQNRIRIDAVSEKKGLTESAPSYLMVLIDQVDETTLNTAVVALQKLGCVQGDVKRIELEKMADGHLV